MATKKISELTALTSPDGAEELLINDGGTSKKITITNATASKLPLAGGTMTGNISHASHFTLDVGGNITLDADNGFVKFADGGTDIAQFAKGSNSNLEIKSLVSDADILFQGNDGNSAITAMTIDMSAGGNVGIGDTSPFSKLEVKDTSWSSGGPYGAVVYIEGGAVNDLNWGHLVVTQSGTTTDTGGRISLGINGANPIAGLRAKYKGATYGDLAFLTRPSGGTNTERMVIDSAGNVGIGVTPASWVSTFDALQMGEQASLYAHQDGTGDDSALYLGINVYNDGTEKHLRSDKSSLYRQQSGGHKFYVNSSGTADAAISWTNALSIGNDGTVTIDQDTDNEALIIDSEATSYGTAVINGKYPLMATQDVSSGYAGKFTRNLDEAGSYPLVRIVDNHTTNEQAALYIQQDGAGYGIEIDQNGNSQAIYIDSEATSYNVIHSNGKYGIRSNQDISGGYAIYAYRNIDEAGSYPLLRITDDHTSNTQPALKIQQDGAGYGLQIDQNGNNIALYIDSESTTTPAIAVESKWGIESKQDISGGYAAYFNRNLAEAGSYPLVHILDNHNSNTQPALKIQQNGAGYGLQIDQNGNNPALYIDCDASGNYGILAYARYGMWIQQDIANGYAGYFTRNLDEAGSQPLVAIVDDHANNTSTALKIQQDGAGRGIDIDQNGSGIALYVDNGSIDEPGIFVNNANLTTGKAAYFYSNSADTSTRNLVEIHNDHASATGTTALYVKQDSTGNALKVEGTFTVRSSTLSIFNDGNNVENVRMLNSGTTFNADGIDKDFTVLSDNNAAMLFVDGGNDRVGIGTASPAKELHTVNASQSVANRVAYDGTYYTDYGYRSVNTQSNDFFIMITDAEKMRISTDGSVWHKETGNNGDYNSFIGSISQNNNADQYCHIQLDTDGGDMFWFEIIGYDYNSGGQRYGRCGGYMYGSTGHVYSRSKTGDIVEVYQKMDGVSKVEIVYDTGNTGTSNRWGSAVIRGGTDTITSSTPIKIVQHSYTSTTAQVWT